MFAPVAKLTPAQGGHVTVAVIEDNLDLRECVVLNLEARGIATSAFADGASFDAALQGGGVWQVLVLDVGLPGEDGLSIARRMRTSHPELGIVMLTALGTVDDRIIGMNIGADIYLVKPASMDELAAAIQAVARRLAQTASDALAWHLDTTLMTILSPDGAKTQLSYGETAIFQVLARDPDHFGARDDLVAAMNKRPEVYDPRAFEVTMSRLRRKLGTAAPLKSVRNRGYVFAARLIILGQGRS